MPRYIIKLVDGQQAWYMEWSTIVDAPVSYGMPLEAFKDYWKDAHEQEGLQFLEERLVRVEETGCSSMEKISADELIAANRAGPEESCLTKQQLIRTYCLEQE